MAMPQRDDPPSRCGFLLRRASAFAKATADESEDKTADRHD